ncbi:CASP C terminal-domain-containing protein [Lineolata rhizophorae]|uniref:Protein CASP n=1 Tax=Lineolata rhizophorae TaxID=578093 RepID=A0A6A6PD97_9PEZI|nr:CASP C terminal-domain-containing protein [Lineolata rhizophorae]
MSSTPPEGDAPAASESAAEDNKFQTAIAAWRNVDLSSLIPQLDTAASDLVTHQRDALTQRKDLAQKTKDFKKLDDTSKLGEIKGLLKSYQTFIDLLTNQSKAVSTAFFQAYTPLSEAPDPYPLLEASVDALISSSETVPKLADENAHLQRTVAKLTTQLDDTEQKLEKERTARQALEEERESKVKDIEASWERVLTEKEDNWAAKERSLEDKVENQDRLLKELKASYEVSQRLGQGNEGDAAAAAGTATAAELEIVSSELDKATMRLAEVEARNEQLRFELAQSASVSQTQEQASSSVEDDPAFLRLQSENGSLRRKLDAAKFEKDSERRKLEGDMRGLEREIGGLRKERDGLRERVQKWGDYESVKRELEVLKSIEFATGDDDDHLDDAPTADADADAQQNGATSKGDKGGETLEQLLLARNKKLSNELTVLRVSHQDLQQRLETLQEELSSANMDLEKSRSLTATLENDLLRVQQEAANSFGGGANMSSAMSVAPSRYPQSSYGGRRAGGGRPSSPTSSIISGFDPHRAGGGDGGDHHHQPMGGGSGILPMVTAQRDRFKKRNTELEAELAKTHQTVSSLRSEIAALQRDNLNLYEKTRYISTYSRGGAGQHPGAAYSSANDTAGGGASATAISIGGGTSASPVSADSRYRSAYESHLSPFAAFRGRESARALRRMPLPERVLLRLTRAVLASRLSRNLFAAYCLALHLLVLGMLFYWGGREVDSAASGLGEAAAACIVP